jgi:hypothetical protein
MDIFLTCDECGKNLVIDEAGAGITIDCPECGTPVYVPSALQQEPQNAPARVEVKSTARRTTPMPAPAADDNPPLPSFWGQERSTVHPSIAAGVHCLLILVAVQFVGFIAMRQSVLWMGIFLAADVPFMFAPLLCAVYAMCIGHVRSGFSILVGLALIIGISYWVIFSPIVQPSPDALRRQAEEMQQQFKQFLK